MHAPMLKSSTATMLNRSRSYSSPNTSSSHLSNYNNNSLMSRVQRVQGRRALVCLLLQRQRSHSVAKLGGGETPGRPCRAAARHAAHIGENVPPPACCPHGSTGPQAAECKPTRRLPDAHLLHGPHNTISCPLLKQARKSAHFMERLSDSIAKSTRPMLCSFTKMRRATALPEAVVKLSSCTWVEGLRRKLGYVGRSQRCAGPHSCQKQ